jgi:hypothetical protein
VDARGRRIPAQKEVTGRWSVEKTIQWVRFDALLASDGQYSVEIGQPDAEPSPGVRLTLVEQNGRVTVDTGAAQYVLGRGISPIQEIRTRENLLATSAGTRGLYVVDQQGRLGSASSSGETLAIEAFGPIASCVRFEGDYRTEDGDVLARHITRVENWAGQPFARITHTLVLTQDTNKIWFKEVGWEFGVDPGGDPMALFATERGKQDSVLQKPLDDAQPAIYMLQDEHYRFAHGKNHFRVAGEGIDGRSTVLQEGEECGDWAAVGGRRGGLLLFCREAARQHPKEFEIRRDRVVLRLFSNRANEELDFRVPSLVKKWDRAAWYDKIEDVLQQVSQYPSNAVGWSKTHELMVSPLDDASAETPAKLADLHSRPLLAMADPAWICRSEMMGPIHPKDDTVAPWVEKPIEAAFKQWNQKVADWGDYGFVDYAMGPHFEYLGKYVRQYRYSDATCTLRPDSWLLYARSGDRAIREFAQTTNRGQMDGCMAHCDGPLKTCGLFLNPSRSDEPEGGANPGMLPFYWENALGMHMSSSSNLNGCIWDYQLTGYRRAKDVVLEYASGVKRAWKVETIAKNDRPLMVLRMLVQAYGLTGDVHLRRLANATMDALHQPAAQLGIVQKRSLFDTEEKETTYKLGVDARALIEAWRILGDRRCYDAAMKVSRHSWGESLCQWPLSSCNPDGVIGSFLYHETNDPRYVQGLALQMRAAAGAYDPKTGVMSGVESADMTTFLFEGIPYAKAALAKSGAEKAMLASWASYEEFGFPSSVVVKNTGNAPLQLDVWPSRNLRMIRVDKPDQRASDLPWVVKDGYSHQSLKIPAFTSEGVFHVLPVKSGQQVVLANRKVPMVIYAPYYWRPAPEQPFGVKYYFRLPPNSEKAQIVFEGSAKLVDAQGQPWRGGEALHGAVDLPPDRPGLWSFLPVDNQLVQVRNLPPFFAVEDPATYFEPPIGWRRETVPANQPMPDRTSFVDGAIATPGNRSLYVSRTMFHFSTGLPHPSGDGNQFMPRKQGTIEFWYRPNWSSLSLRSEKRALCRLPVPGGEQPYCLQYEMAPRNPNAELDFLSSHVLLGDFHASGPAGQAPLRVWRRTVFDAQQWYHIAWVWGQRNGVEPNAAGRKADETLVMELYVDGRRGQSQYEWRFKGLPLGVPSAFQMQNLDASVDELRISDVQRYSQEFAPPKRTSEFPLDAHTRALFHFNGDVRGESYGAGAPIAAELK